MVGRKSADALRREFGDSYIASLEGFKAPRLRLQMRLILAKRFAAVLKMVILTSAP
jgi:hypothetical protein